jgi:hypothetical protein
MMPGCCVLGLEVFVHESLEVSSCDDACDDGCEVER